MTIDLNDIDHPDPNRAKSDVVLGTPGNDLDPDDFDVIITGAGNDVVCADSGDDHVELGPGRDRVRGGAGRDSLHGGAGDDVLLGGAHSDVASYWNANHPIRIDLAIKNEPQITGFGKDTLGSVERISGAQSFPNKLFGTDGKNVLSGGNAADLIYGRGGNDGVSGGLLGEGDRIYGGEGNDSVQGAGLVTGGVGNDQVWGYQGGDILRGGPGNDHLEPEAGPFSDPYNDDPYTPTESFGGPGRDFIKAGWRDEKLHGGPGIDLVTYRQASAKLHGDGIEGGVQVSLALTEPQDTWVTGVDELDAFEYLEGTNFDDDLTGNDGANTLFGSYGNDNMDGAGGVDICQGGDSGDPSTDDFFTNCETVGNPCTWPHCGPPFPWPDGEEKAVDPSGLVSRS